MSRYGKLESSRRFAYYHPTSNLLPTCWNERVFDMMNYLVGRYGPCKIERASRSTGITAVFKGRHKVSISEEGVTEWLTEEPPNA